MKYKNLLPILGLVFLLSFRLNGQTSRTDFSQFKDQVQKAIQEQKSSKVDSRLKNLLNNSDVALQSRTTEKQKLNISAPIVEGNNVKVTLTLKQRVDSNTEHALARLGFQQTAAIGKTVVGSIPLDQLSQLEEMDQIHRVKPTATGNAFADLGVAEAQGDSAMFTNVLKDQFLTNGAGVKIGIISNSFNNLGGQAASVLAGDLPGTGNPNGFTTDIQILNDFPAPFGITDEGRAMAELIHDIAPGAELAFNNAPTTSDATLAQSINELVAAGCHIIVDDITIIDEPYFIDGLASRAINAATAAGVSYFSSAGNAGRTGVYERIGYSTVDVGIGLPVFNFSEDPTVVRPAIDYLITSQSSITLILQWDEPWFSLCDNCGGAQNELDFVIFLDDEFITVVTAESIGGDAINTVTIENLPIPSGQDAVLSILLAQTVPNQGTPGRIKLRENVFNALRAPGIPFDQSPTSLGHKTAEGSITVGAATFVNTPAYDPVLQTAVAGFDGATFFTSTTSVGGAPILFDEQGTRIPPLVRQTPSIVGPDGSETSFFGVNVAGSSNPRFLGTSASAPSVAAAAALLLQGSGKAYSPQDIRDVLEFTAQDMDDPYDNGVQVNPQDPLFATGYDFTTGFGFVRPLDAFNLVLNDVGSEDIEIEEVCSENPSSERRWKVTNPNGFGFDININSNKGIRFPGETTFGAISRTYLLPIGESFIYTAVSGSSTFTFFNVNYSPVGVFGNVFNNNSTNGSVPGCNQSRSTIANNTVSNIRKMTNVVYPNPSSNGKFFMNISSQLNEDQILFQVFDISGRVMKGQFEKQLTNGNNLLEIDLSTYAKGMYLLKATSHSFNESQRLLIE